MIDMPANPTAAALITASRDTQRVLEQIRDALVARDAPAPGMFAIWPGTFRVQPRLRVTDIIVCPIALGSYGIKIGTNVRFKFRGSAGVISIPANIVLNRGESISVVDLATGLEASDLQLIDAWLFAHVDYSETDANRHSAMHERITT